MLRRQRRLMLIVCGVMLSSALTAMAQTSTPPGGVSFVSRKDFLVGGSYPSEVVVGDFNNDGIQDLATADEIFPSSLDDKVSVLIGRGDGTFSAPIVLGGFLSPNSLAVGDFDRNGFQDLAVTETGFDAGGPVGTTVSLIMNNGDGTIRRGPVLPVGNLPYSVKVSDFNADGIQDLAVANAYSDSVSILLGIGDGTFRPRLNFSVGRVPYSVTVGDFNGDGRQDFATGN